MLEMLVDTKTVEDEEGKTYSFNYYILVDQMAIAQGLSCESYGVKIAGPGGEEAAVENITTSVGRIDQLMELVTRNAVTPVTLRDVVEDWL